MPPDPYTWSAHPEATAALAVLVGLYALALRRFPASRWRVACFLAGTGLILATAVTPIDSLSYRLLLVHLLQNVVLAEWAPALLVLGMPPALAGELGRVRVVRALTRPVVALPVWLGTYFLWHLPPAYDTALEHPVLLHAEHASYLAAGVLFWWSVFQDEPWHASSGARADVRLRGVHARRAARPAARAAARGDLLVLRRRARLWGMSALTDQQLAGITMAGEQAIVFFLVFTGLFFRFLREEEEGPEALGPLARR